MSGTAEQLVVFTLSDLHCALRIPDIKRILPAVDITPVPKAPEIVMGLINIRGRAVPVLTIRRLLGLCEIEMSVNHMIILAQTTTCPVAILVDEVRGVYECDTRAIVAPEDLYPGIAYLQGVTKLQDGIIYIYNLDRFLSSKDRSQIGHLLSGRTPMPACRETEDHA